VTSTRIEHYLGLHAVLSGEELGREQRCRLASSVCASNSAVRMVALWSRVDTHEVAFEDGEVVRVLSR
jgi:hypothetical protein